MKLKRRVLTLLCAVIMTLSCTITAFAASVSVRDLYWAFDGEAPTWEDIVSVATQDSEDIDIGDDAESEEEYKKYLKAVAIYQAFGSAGAYNKILPGLQKYVAWNDDIEDIEPAINTTTGQQNYTRAITAFEGAVGAAVTEQTIDGIFDMENWNPNAGFATPFLDWFYGAVNTGFYVISNLVIWWFLFQTALDVLYLVAEPVRPFISSASGSSSGYSGSYSSNNAGSFASKIKIPLCSDDVIRACNGGGGNSGYSTYGGNAKTTNPALIYIMSRGPLIIVIGVYLVLVSTGWWPKIIAWVAGIVTRLLSLVIK